MYRLKIRNGNGKWDLIYCRGKGQLSVSRITINVKLQSQFKWRRTDWPIRISNCLPFPKWVFSIATLNKSAYSNVWQETEADVNKNDRFKQRPVIFTTSSPFLWIHIVYGIDQIAKYGEGVYTWVSKTITALLLGSRDSLGLRVPVTRHLVCPTVYK